MEQNNAIYPKHHSPSNSHMQEIKKINSKNRQILMDTEVQAQVYLYNMQCLHNSTKHCMLVVQPWSGHCGNKELRTIDTWASICHRHSERPAVK